MQPGFWKGKRVFITGHTGFKGSWLSLWLQRSGAEIMGYSVDVPTTPSLFEVANVANGMSSVSGDIRDFEKLASTMSEFAPEIVFHLAAQSLVRESYATPVETYSTNVMGTVHMLEAARRCQSVSVIINVTSDKCYENREWLWGYRESEAMGGYDPYSSSKGCAELVTAAYRRSFFEEASGRTRVALASVRAGNVIGGGDWANDRLIPDAMKAVMEGRAVRIRRPESVRPWQHVLEPLNGYMMLAEKLYERGESFAEGWNFGPWDDDARPVSWIIEKVVGLWGEAAGWERDGASHPHEAKFLKLDSSKARARLGWRPKLDLETALSWVVEWYKGYRAQRDMRVFTERQIGEFEELKQL